MRLWDKTHAARSLNATHIIRLAPRHVCPFRCWEALHRVAIPLKPQETRAHKVKVYQFTVLPDRLSMALRIFTRCIVTALIVLQARGIKILALLDHWLIVSPMWKNLARNTAFHLSHVNWLSQTKNYTNSFYFSQILFFPILIYWNSIFNFLFFHQRV